MGECLILRRGGEAHKLPVLNENYPQDANVTVIKGNSASATFTVSIAEAGSPAEYTYKWYVNGSLVSGANLSSYTKSDLTDSGTYTVYCEVINKAGTVTSRIATLKVVQYYTPVLNSSYPANVTSVHQASSSATFKVSISTAGNPASYTYQWYWNGSAVSGATSSSYTRTGALSAGSYTVYCKVTNAAGTVTSRTATWKIKSSTAQVSSGSINITGSGYNWDGVVTGTTTVTFSNLGTGNGYVDVFLVGGGGGGGHSAGGGGGGGYTTTKTLTLKEGVAYTFEVGAGGAKSTDGGGKGGWGGTTSIKQGSTILASVSGGEGGMSYNGDGSKQKRSGGDGGSGGGGGGGNGDGYGENDWAGSGGYNGSNGTSSTGLGGTGQGTTTYGFGSSAYSLYSGGGAGGFGGYLGNSGSPGAGGGGHANSDGGTNTGGGGGGGTHDIETTYAGNGGSGIILIRNHR